MEKQEGRTVVGIRMSIEERRLIKMVCACTGETQAELLSRLVKDEMSRIQKNPALNLVKSSS